MVSGEDNEVDAEELLELLRGLLAELAPGRAPPDPRLDSRLDGDLGMDSLSRAELLQRAGRRFGVEIPSRALAEIETPRDLLGWLEDPGAGKPRGSAAPVKREGAAAFEHAEAAPSLDQVLVRHAEAHPDRVWVHLQEDGRTVTELTYAGILDRARARAAALQARGIQKGDTIALMLPTGATYLETFFGALLLGAVPVPLYPPARPSQLADHLRRQVAILRSAETKLLVTVPEARPFAHLITPHAPDLEAVLAANDLSADPDDLRPARVEPGDLAFLQYTSGSTGTPKGVRLTHANLLANIRGFCDGVAATPDDLFVSWLPLYHDLGLIGACLGTMFRAVPLVLMSPLDFLTRPARWLEALSLHRGTLSAAPNFAYDLCVARVTEEERAPLDLSAWRQVVDGAEPISVRTVERFVERFGPSGFRPEVFGPCYGLAECSLGLTISPLDRPVLAQRVDREVLLTRGVAEPAPEDSPEALAIVGCGFPIPGHELRVVDEDDRELPENHQGRIQFRGPSATAGYHRNPEATARLIRGDWLETGDLGYVSGGELFPTGRAKDVIIRAGRNIHPHEVENAVAELEGVRRGCVAVLGVRDPRRGTERLVVTAETRLTDAAARRDLEARILATSGEVLDAPADEVVLLPPGSVLKTSSGKIRRADITRAYEEGTLGAPRPGVARQVLALGLEAALPWARRLLRLGARRAWAAWFWLWFGGLGLVCWVLAAAIPHPGLRWRALRAVCRFAFLVTGIPPRVEGLARIPGHGPCVVVANHASYADSPLLIAVSPRPLRPVVKAELADHWFSRIYFTRLGALFVERFDMARAVEDTARVREAATRGDALVFFPEGTFYRHPGLLPFRIGAFAVAAELALDVVPVVLRGTRDLLRPDQWTPRWVRPEVEVLEVQRDRGRDLAAAARLRDATRAEILRRCGEPDLDPPRREREEAACPPP